MKRIILTLCLALTAVAASAQYVDDMYDTTPSKPKKKNNTSAQTYEQPLSSTTSSQNQNEELITTYEQALERRLNALRNVVEMDDSYWQLLQQYQGILEAKYDKNLYNIVVVGNDMWVEPQSVTALFDGSDPAEGVIKYNDQIKKGLSQPARQTEYSNNASSISGGGGGGGSDQPIVININVDPWTYSGWNYGWGYPYNYGWGYPYNYGWGFSYSWGGGWYNPWYSPWHYHHYDPWYNPWHNPWYPTYHNSYYSNPRGTYYGNSASARIGNQSGWGLGGTTRQPRGVDGISTTRSSDGRVSSIRPTGSNTVTGIGSRNGRGNSTIIGGVADLRNSGAPIGIGRDFESRGRTNTRITTPNTVQYETGRTFERTTRPDYNSNRDVNRGRTNFERQDIRPAERPATYERPMSRPTTYERPSSFERSTPTYSRPSSSGSSGGGIVARPSRGR